MRQDADITRTESKSIPTMELLEKEVGMLKEQVALVADQFQRIYAVVPEPAMKDDTAPTNPESLEPKRLKAVIRDIDKINMRLRTLERKVAQTMDELVGVSK